MLLLILCFACSRGKYSVSNAFRKGDCGNMETMLLDSSYRFYLREVFLDKNQLNENVLNSNVEIGDTANRKRIEVEYLLISRAYNNAIYITTVADKYQHYYSTNRYADTLINAYDFSTFHFGKISGNGESIVFESGESGKIINWDIRPFLLTGFPTKISIREIDVRRKDKFENTILINRALEQPITFRQQKNFTIIFEPPSWKTDTCNEYLPIRSLSDQRIYFDKMKNGYDLFFRFNENIGNSKDSAIRFDSKRIRYMPFKQQLN
jgi:hypothetical protein